MAAAQPAVAAADRLPPSLCSVVRSSLDGSIVGQTGMMTKGEARAAVEAELATLIATHRGEPGELVVMDDFTVERPWGWVFFYNSRRFAETREPLQALAGNAPYIVNRTTGEVRVTGTARPTEEYIAEYEASLGMTGPNS